MKTLLSLLVLSAVTGPALGNPVPGLAADFVELGWWVVPCEDMIAMPDLQPARDAEAAGLAVCVRSHTPNLTEIKDTVAAAVPTAEWKDVFQLLHVGEATLGDHRFQALHVPMSGLILLSFDPVD